MFSLRVAAFLVPVLLPVAGQESQFGGKYSDLSPLQKQLVGLRSAEAGKIFKRPVDPATVYNKLPLSARTTFEAVTHALSRSNLTSGSGKPYGTALDLVEMVERVAGSVPGARGDSQFRVYVYLKPEAVDKLYNCREFKRAHDNTVFHIGYPINFRQQGGVPSIQISVARTGRRADIDVDYRPSAGVQALTSGHLTAANSDVRAGDNHERHVRRWEGLGQWWRALMAGLLGAQPQIEMLDFTPEGHPELEKKARGSLPDMIHSYLEEWLVKQNPVGVLSAVSIKAYPCVAEFADGSHPDSRLALTRIVNQMMEVNKRLGRVSRLEDALIPVSYPLPEGQPVQHQYSRLFAIQRVHEDVAWAIDCRIRYGLQLQESIPRPEHRMEESYVVSYKLNEKDRAGFLVQTWGREAGAWKLLSFDIKRTHLTPPPDLLTRAANPPGAIPADPKLQSDVEKFLTGWLIERRIEDAARVFLPESFSCDALSASGDTPSPGNVRRFLEQVAAQAPRESSLGKSLSAASAGHPELKPLTHGNSGAYLLAQASAGLLRTNACRQGGSPSPAAGSSPPGTRGAFVAFHLSRSRQESAGVISFYWKQVKGEWRISSYGISAD
jgi:hypothetical protein